MPPRTRTTQLAPNKMWPTPTRSHGRGHIRTVGQNRQNQSATNCWLVPVPRTSHRSHRARRPWHTRIRPSFSNQEHKQSNATILKSCRHKSRCHNKMPRKQHDIRHPQRRIARIRQRCSKPSWRTLPADQNMLRHLQSAQTRQSSPIPKRTTSHPEHCNENGPRISSRSKTRSTMFQLQRRLQDVNGARRTRSSATTNTRPNRQHNSRRHRKRNHKTKMNASLRHAFSLNAGQRTATPIPRALGKRTAQQRRLRHKTPPTVPSPRIKTHLPPCQKQHFQTKKQFFKTDQAA